jgi:hypothetical protein
MGSLRCKLTGCDLNECGICRRCKSEEQGSHDWADVERERPCFAQKRCTRCDAEQETPDHDWESRPGVVEAIELVCTRCGLKI